MSPIYTTQVEVEGGRAGKAKSSDGFLSIDLTLPKAFGGDGKPGTNPEQLFAAGYAACFESTLRFIAGQKSLKITSSKVLARVDVLSDPKGGFLLAVDLGIELRGIERVEAEALVEAAQKVCPYHKMVHGNISQNYRLI